MGFVNAVNGVEVLLYSVEGIVVRSLVSLFSLIILGLGLSLEAHAYNKTYDLFEQAKYYFPEADQYQQAEGIKVVVAYQNKQAIGFSFTNEDILSIPAYSGKPINSLIAMNAKGDILSAKLLEHHEPILLVGIPEIKLENFVSKFVGFNAADQVRIGSGNEDKTIDAITGATVTVMVVNEAIMKAVNKVAKHFQIAGLTDDSANRAKVNKALYQPLNWQQLLDQDLISKLQLKQQEVNELFIGTAAETRVENDDEQAEFINLFFANLNIPSVGKNLLGESEYRWLMEEALQAGDTAFAVMANGSYSFKGNGYVRGGIFDRTQLHQDNQVTIFRDLDYIRLNDVYVEGFPDLKEMAIFISRAKNEFDVGKPWQLELIIRRQTGAISSLFKSVYADAPVPEAFITRPIVVEPQALWQKVWHQKTVQIGVVTSALALLMIIIFTQDYLVKRPKLLHRVRTSYLLFTVFYLGWYSLGQLSVVNVFTFAGALFSDFHWQLFLLDPIIFLLWGFVAITLLLWGRGVYCGWLCPFGAIQELVNTLARKFKIKQFELPYVIHERLWALKYIILLGLFGLSLESLNLAEQYAEVEPFKTTIMLKFQRQWGFVFYAILLISISAFNHKFYCRYICPLGAALAIPARISLFDWLRRRKECGQPCQLCAVECEVRAITPDGVINRNECHYCLDCQVTYFADTKCPPLVLKNKKRKKKKAANQIDITALD